MNQQNLMTMIIMMNKKGRIGVESDTNENTILFTSDTNLVVDGLPKPNYQYIEAGSARKALIIQKQVLKTLAKNKDVKPDYNYYKLDE